MDSGFFIESLDMEDYTSFLGTAATFAEQEIFKLEEEYAQQRELDIQELIDSGFLDTDYESSSDWSSSETDEFKHPEILSNVPKSVEMKDDGEISEQILFIKDNALFTTVEPTLEAVNTNIMVDTEVLEKRNIENNQCTNNFHEFLEISEEKTSAKDENYCTCEHKESILWSLLSCIVSFAIIMHILEGIHLKKHLNEHRSQNITHLNEIMSKMGVYYVLMAELEMQHMQNFHTTDFLQFHEQFVWQPLISHSVSNSMHEQTMFRTVVHIEEGVLHKTSFAIPVPGQHFIVREFKENSRNNELMMNGGSILSYSCVMYPALNSVSVAFRHQRLLTNSMITASLITIMYVINRLLSENS